MPFWTYWRLSGSLHAWLRSARPYLVFAVLDLALPPLVAALLADLLLRAGDRRNRPLVAMLLLLAVAKLAFHLAVARVIDVPPSGRSMRAWR